MREAWETDAEAWARVARHGDPFFRVNGGRFLELLPPPSGTAVLDLGCGEGRLGAWLQERGYEVLGVESSPTLARRAAERHRVVEADAAALPFDDDSFELVVAFMSLHDMDDMDAAVREAGRVLRRGGRFCLAISHPFRTAGRRRADGELEVRSYFATLRFRATVGRGDLTLEVEQVHRSLEAYFRALEAAGLLVDAVREVDGDNGSVPVALHVRAVRP
jgi:SAM-dependent methyltransferase